MCGGNIPSNVDTEDNIAHIHFESDGSGNGKGFRLEFAASEDSKLSGMMCAINDLVKWQNYLIMGYVCITFISEIDIPIGQSSPCTTVTEFMLQTLNVFRMSFIILCWWLGYALI